jgi:sodium/bile acid cotransporter 7
MKKFRALPFPRKPLLAIAFLFLGLLPANGVARNPPVSSPADEENLQTVYAMYDGYRKDFPQVAEMEPEEAMKRWRAEEIVFIDTRTPEEMAVSMLPGAVSQSEYIENPDRFGDRTPVAYCTISYRSGIFAKEMAENGRKIWNLRGGMLAWTLEGGPIFQGGEETRRMHVYGKKWDLAPPEYETVRFSRWQQFRKSRD